MNEKLLTLYAHMLWHCLVPGLCTDRTSHQLSQTAADLLVPVQTRTPEGLLFIYRGQAVTPNSAPLQSYHAIFTLCVRESAGKHF